MRFEASVTSAEAIRAGLAVKRGSGDRRRAISSLVNSILKELEPRVDVTT